MALLTRDQILDADDLEYEDVSVPEWGGEVRVMTLTGTARDKFEAAIANTSNGKPDLTNFRAKLAAASIVNEAGEQLFNEADVRKLGRKSAAALTRVASAAQRLSGLTEADVKELAGNSEPGQSGDSASA